MTGPHADARPPRPPSRFQGYPLMKKSLFPFALVALVGITTAVIAKDAKQEKPWFDVENCALCRHMAEHQHLMTEIKTETHLLENGMITVALIPDEHRQAMNAIHVKMRATFEELKEGKKLPLCGFCESHGALMDAGAREEEIETSFGMIGIVTSEKAEIIQQIRAHATKSIEMYRAFLEQAAQQ